MRIDFKIDVDEFKKKYQERMPLIIKGSLDTKNVLWSDINDIISRCDPQSENFRVSFPGGNIEKEKYVNTYFHVGDVRRKLNKPALYNLLRQGGTLVANHIYDEPKFNDYAKDIAQFTGRQTVTSAYIAFGETDSYRAHWDSRDVFAVQLKGRKRWVVYKPTFDAPLFMHQSKFIEDRYPCPAEPHMDFVLEEGDVFYIPRGWWHNVTPLGEPTVHLAIGTFPAFAVDYVKWVFRELPDCIYARMALEDFEQDAETIRTLSKHIYDRMNDPSCYRAFMEAHIGEQILETRLNLEKLGDASITALESDNEIRLNVLRADISDEYFITGGGKVWLEDELRPVRDFLVAHPRLKVSHLHEKFPDYSRQQLSEVLHLLATNGTIEVL
ncbi:JmjC domain-containing protein [Burkholderia multivorans]|uniref:JmjC domain-containing protein n=1 Tax=Burkholderia multivorans TaxID=87883 RepID=UPI00027820A1|nr:cupin domain-containing protein [Burkholderia multivorans]EJO53869.1 cupin domain protein, PF06172 family [Burkholderia multivorans CF2]MBU9474635.1 cupin domain-containing protein [Burkholderia multivorans]